ncbi:hypothetical protein M0D21_01415 [Aquimarina sp. D1M17]|uniref:hypothetical protein n=1 Tax=Aquimarina acroporae TaxID=2937283 RepID=UPI0020BEC8BF|nr:hypothetical protein [Aquimarina acroporae]MCK8520202.1 hypothetical protein [Aquimarina acroporae]
MAYTDQFLNAIQKHLLFHKIIEPGDDITNRNLKNNIIDFQDKAGIYTDGIIGPETLWEIQFPYVMSTEKMNWVRCEADKINGIEGFDNFILREDAARQYNLLKQEIRDRGGKITSSGGKRSLTAGVNNHRSAKSMHYAGLALDLSINSGFFSPKTDPFVMVKNKGTNPKSYWQVYCRAQGGELIEIEATYWDSWGSGKDKKIKIKDRFIDFTATAEKYGFHPISPRRGYLRSTNKQYLSSEWWHFQANPLLIPEFSQFGIELLKIEDYSPEFIRMQNRSIWGNRKSIFRKNWW